MAPMLSKALLRRWPWRVGALMLGAAALAVQGQTPADEERQLERIRAERAAADTAYQRKVQECAQRFVVTSCVDDARAERHAQHLRLDREQQVIDEARRQQRAAVRQQAIDSKSAGEAAREREAAASARSQARPAASQPVARAASASASAVPRSAKPAPSAAERSEQEARARRAYELKQLQAEAHRREVEERNAERARKTNPGKSLPAPGASSPVAASAPG
jgi:colicin import membrane protein